MWRLIFKKQLTFICFSVFLFLDLVSHSMFSVSAFVVIFVGSWIDFKVVNCAFLKTETKTIKTLVIKCHNHMIAMSVKLPYFRHGLIRHNLQTNAKTSEILRFTQIYPNLQLTVLLSSSALESSTSSCALVATFSFCWLLFFVCNCIFYTVNFLQLRSSWWPVNLSRHNCRKYLSSWLNYYK